MSINPSRYVDTSGRIYLPYITEWKKVLVIIFMLSVLYKQHMIIITVKLLYWKVEFTYNGTFFKDRQEGSTLSLLCTYLAGST